jgi:hypothetical protein
VRFQPESIRQLQAHAAIPQRETATTALQERGGACEGMLSCKTDSAKLKQPGGPVSSPWISIAILAGSAKISGAWSREPTKRNAIGSAVIDFATRARRSLQHGVFAAGFFFGVECIGQPLISGLDSADEMIAPSAQ